MQKELSIIIPAYNEAELIGATLEEIRDFFKSRTTRYEILVVNDGSTDGTQGIIERAAASNPSIHFIHQSQNSGKGMAVKTGVAAAKYSLCLFMDADGATSIKEWPAFETAFDAGAQAVHASRHLPGSRIDHPQPLLRRILGAGYRAICSRVFGISASDFNCGFKAYRTDLARQIYAKVQMLDWSFDVEVIARLKKAGVTPVELPVRWRHCEKKYHLAPVSTAVKTFQSIAKLKKILQDETVR